MLRDGSFGRWTAYFGIAGHGLDLLHILPVLVLIPLASSEAAWAIGVPILLIGGVFQLVWYPMVGLRLLRFGR